MMKNHLVKFFFKKEFSMRFPVLLFILLFSINHSWAEEAPAASTETAQPATTEQAAGEGKPAPEKTGEKKAKKEAGAGEEEPECD